MHRCSVSVHTFPTYATYDRSSVVNSGETEILEIHWTYVSMAWDSLTYLTKSHVARVRHPDYAESFSRFYIQDSQQCGIG